MISIALDNKIFGTNVPSKAIFAIKRRIIIAVQTQPWYAQIWPVSENLIV